VSVSSRVTGPIVQQAGGWYVNYYAGTPNLAIFDSIQVNVADVLLFAIPYPSGTTFSVYAQAPPWCTPGTPPYKPWYTICTHNYTATTSVMSVYNGPGDTYYFDSANQLMYIKIVALDAFYPYPYFGTNASGSPPWNSTVLYNTWFSRGGLSLLTTGNSYMSIRIQVTSNNCNPNCPILPVNVPAALNVAPPPTNSPTPPTGTPSIPTVPPTSSSLTAAPTTPPPTNLPTVPTAQPTQTPTLPGQTYAPSAEPTQTPTNKGQTFAPLSNLSSASNGPSGGTIAGAIIGTILALALLAVIAYLIYNYVEKSRTHEIV